jgi:hypothetical protein
VRAGAAEALGRLGVADPQTLQALRETLRDESPGVRARAAEALGHLGVADPETLQALREALRDESPGVRARAAEALGIWGLPTRKPFRPCGRPSKMRGPGCGMRLSAPSGKSASARECGSNGIRDAGCKPTGRVLRYPAPNSVLGARYPALAIRSLVHASLLIPVMMPPPSPSGWEPAAGGTQAAHVKRGPIGAGPWSRPAGHPGRRSREPRVGTLRQRKRSDLRRAWRACWTSRAHPSAFFRIVRPQKVRTSQPKTWRRLRFLASRARVSGSP